MPSPIIVVDRRSDFRWPDPGNRVVTAEGYTLDREPPPRSRVINLCRDYAYLGAGYYVSLLAEARGHRVVPDVRAFSEMDRRTFHDSHAAALERAIADAADIALTAPLYSLDVYFGEAEDSRFRDLARHAFQRLRCPLLRIQFDCAHPGRIVGVHALHPRDVPAERDGFFLAALDAHLQQHWRMPHLAATTRFDLAVLREVDDPLPPSKPKTLERLAEVGATMGVNVVPIEKRDYSRIAQFDALFIRETTAVTNHTFRFARKAEREGIPVIDDPSSILRCTNKVFLAELLRGNGVPTPGTYFATRRGGLDAIERRLDYPVVVKIPDGSFSIGVERAQNRQELRDIAARMLKRSEIILIQDFVKTEFDWRIGVLDGEPLFAARYYMCGAHWQILKHAADGSHSEGETRAYAFSDVPPAVLDAAVRAARLVGRGLYGVDVKETPAGAFVIEVNDNPNIDVGMEDTVLGDELYRRLLAYFLRQAEALRPNRIAAGMATGADVIPLSVALG